MSGGMNPRWRSPIVGKLGSSGMANPSDHSTSEKTESIIDSDTPIYLMSESANKMLSELYTRVALLESRCEELGNKYNELLKVGANEI
jgi:hypothetical protein